MSQGKDQVSTLLAPLAGVRLDETSDEEESTTYVPPLPGPHR